MNKVEITYRTVANEMEKLNARLARNQKNLEKKKADAIKYGVENMTKEEHIEWMKTVEHDEWGIMKNKEDINKNGAWFDYIMAQEAIEETEWKIENAMGRLEKAEAELDKHNEELEKITDAKQKEMLWQKEFEEEQAEWKKDGIILENRYCGLTPKGKRFFVGGNHGFTERSLHCVTLYIDGETVFTSGEFWLAYIKIKNA